MDDENSSSTARQVLQIVPRITRVMAAEFRHSNPQMIPAHFHVLRMLCRRSWTLTELAEPMQVSLPTMSNTVTTLEERGWVVRTRSTEDRRIVVIQVTEEGRNILWDVLRRAEDRIAVLLAPLDEPRRQALLRGLEILSEVFELDEPAHTDEERLHRCKNGP